MNPLRFIASLLLLTLVTFAPASAQKRSLLHHQLKVKLHPQEHSLSAEDRVTLPDKQVRGLTFLLHAGLKPVSGTPGVSIILEDQQENRLPLEVYRVEVPAGVESFLLTYQGPIHHPLESYGKEYARGIRESPGTISPEGVYLAGSSFWYPDFGVERFTFNLEVSMPAGWEAISQGKRSRHQLSQGGALVRWDSPQPQVEAFLVAGQFTEYQRQGGKVEGMVFLRAPDERLAGKYLDATTRYITMYERLLGPYPYSKFALIENFWETGFGMPSFTLLGPKVIRLPFILTSSYPHEILHNWWGNGVYPDYQKGNWSEGLTAYLSDHLSKEQRGQGAEYRLATLQKYSDYVSTDRDFPLVDFRSRHGSPSEAVGYGKSLMFFHMLRLNLGDETFIKGLRDFYRKNKFLKASFDNLRESFERVSGQKLKGQFEQWVVRSGAPQLRLNKVNVIKDGPDYLITAGLEQLQPGPAYHLRIPLAVTLEDKSKTYQTVAEMRQKSITINLNLKGKPLRLDIDPQFDLFRRLDRSEIPPAISQVLGAGEMLIVLPSKSDDLEGYRQLAGQLRRSGAGKAKVILDSEMEELLTGRSVILLGWENRFAGQLFSALEEYEVEFSKTGVRINNRNIPRTRHSLVLTARHPQDENSALMWVASSPPSAFPGLGRKLPHYHKYSYLGFEGEEPKNILKGRWPVIDSSMSVHLGSREKAGAGVEIGSLAPRKPLAALPSAISETGMMETIRFLSQQKLEGRGFGSPGLDQAAQYIAARFKKAGLVPGGNKKGSYYQVWQERGGEPVKKATLKNVVGIIPGSNPKYKGQSVVIGAHYDHLGRGWPESRTGKKGKIHPGADDNASGVAVLIELARLLVKAPPPERSVVFVAFSAEEAGKLGSRRYVKHYRRYAAKDAIGMVNLDTVGRLGGGKLQILSADSAREWTHIFQGAGFVHGIGVQAVPGKIDSSDHISFIEAGVPAVQLFSGPNLDFHNTTDTADKIDAEGLVKVAKITREAIEYLASRPEPMNSSLAGGKTKRPKKGEGRKVSLGTVPDFAYQGEGYRLGGIVPGSPAESAGLRAGDIIVKVGHKQIRGLRDLSGALKSYSPGDSVAITFRRNSVTKSAQVVLAER